MLTLGTFTINGDLFVEKLVLSSSFRTLVTGFKTFWLFGKMSLTPKFQLKSALFDHLHRVLELNVSLRISSWSKRQVLAELLA